MFYKGLSDHIKDWLVAIDWHDSLKELQDAALRIDSRHIEREHERSAFSSSNRAVLA